MLVPDTQTELSHAVNPKRAPPVYVGISSSIEPVTVTISPPAGNRFTVVFIRRTEEIDTRSELSATLIDPALEPRVTKMPRLPAPSLAALHCIDVSDSHSVDSHPVCPARPIAVSDVSPSPDPCTVTDVEPVPATLLRDAPLMLPPSIEYPSVMLPPRSPAVTSAAAVPRVPWPPVMHRTDVSDSHSVPSHPVCPARPMAVSAASPSPVPCTVTDADPVSAPLARTIPDIVLPSYDTCSDMTLRLAPMVMEAGNVLPVVKRVSLHARDVYDIHSLASQAVFPNPAICVQLDFMKPCPSMVNVAFTLIVTGWLDTYTCDNTARSYDRTSVRDPPLSPRVATNA